MVKDTINFKNLLRGATSPQFLRTWYILSLMSATRGWHQDAPKKGAERHKMLKECGSRCFLQPKKEGFPVCAKNSDVPCQIDCRGVIAAKIRAKQYHHVELYQAIETLEKRYCGRRKRKKMKLSLTPPPRKV